MSSVSVIGLSAFPSASGATKSIAVLNAQLVKYQVQLADWVNCASCNTQEGKGEIRELSDRLSETQQRIKAEDAHRQGSSSVVRTAESNINDNLRMVLPVLNVVAFGSRSSRSAPSTTDTIGGLINVLA